MRVRRLDKLPKRKVTVGELLDQQDIANVVEEAAKVVNKADEMICIWAEDGELKWITSGMPISRVVYIAEAMKRAVMDDDD